MAKVAAAAQVDRRIGGAIVPDRTRGAHGISCQVCAGAIQVLASPRGSNAGQSPCNQWQGGQRRASVDTTRARRARDALNRSICWPVVVVTRDAHAISCRSGGNSPGHRVWGARPARRLHSLTHQRVVSRPSAAGLRATHAIVSRRACVALLRRREARTGTRTSRRAECARGRTVRTIGASRTSCAARAGKSE